MNKQQLRNQVIQYFRSIGSGENILQCIKQALFLHQQFNPVLLFDILSKGKQKIVVNDWKQYLLDHNIIFNQNQFKYFLNHYGFSSQCTLNQFLEAMIPFNADVVRQFKQKYLDSLEIKDFDPEIQFIFSELLDNQFKFIRTIISIRQDISSITSKKSIENLIKEDLVFQSKPRQSRKFHEQFQKDPNLGFHQLRKFLQIWVSTKQIVHEFYLLNVMRHLKSDKPFEKIIFKNKKKTPNNSAQRRPATAQKYSPITNQKIKQSINHSHNKQDKYNEYKNQVWDQFIKDKLNPSASNNNNSKLTQPLSKKAQQPKDQQYNQLIRESRHQRDLKGINGQPIIGLLEQIVVKQERLQKLRKYLAKLNDFNLINLFKLIDQNNQGYISAKNLSQFVQNHKNQVPFLIDFYARQRGKLRFHQFCLIFRPLSKQLNELIDSRPQHKIPNPFKKQTMKLIQEVLIFSSELHGNIYSRKQQIYNLAISGLQLFRFIDLSDKGFITAQCIKNILHENNIFCDAKDLKCIMRLFKKKIDEQITLSEFENFISL